MTGLCPCLRVGHLGFSPAATARTFWACSPSHLEMQIKGEDMDDAEAKALTEAGKLAGEYLDHIKKSDLADFTPEEFDMLIKTVIEGYREAIGKACEPF